VATKESEEGRPRGGRWVGGKSLTQLYEYYSISSNARRGFFLKFGA